MAPYPPSAAPPDAVVSEVASPAQTEPNRTKVEPPAAAARPPLPDNTEIELKLGCAPAALDRLRRAAPVSDAARGRGRRQTLETVYYDTPDRALMRQRAALRVRRVGGAFVQTLKTEDAPGGIHRGEWEVPVTSLVPDPAAFAGTAAADYLTPFLDSDAAPLTPLFTTRIERRTRQLTVEVDGTETEIELAFDRGGIEAGEVNEPISEVELELKSGAPAALYQLAAKLHAVLPLHLETRSKAARGYRLAGAAECLPEKTSEPAYRRDATVEQALDAIVRSCQQHWLANQASALDGTDPEGVHQGRVALRRLRSALSVFRQILPGSQLEWLREEAKWLAGELGPARDWDVFLAELLDPVAKAFPDRQEISLLRDTAEAMRNTGYDGARTAIRSPRATAFLLALGDWLESRGWRDSAALQPDSLGQAPMHGEARRQLRKRHRQVIKLGRGFAALSPDARHRLRIAIKKVRYLTEFYQPLYPRKRSKPYLVALKSLQDGLGHLNDVAVVSRLIDSALESRQVDQTAQTAEAEMSLRTGAGLVIGWHSRGAVDGEDDLRARWQAFRRAKPFWGE